MREAMNPFNEVDIDDPDRSAMLEPHMDGPQIKYIRRLAQLITNPPEVDPFLVAKACEHAASIQD